MVSTDIAKRSVIIELALPDYSPEWLKTVTELITEHRVELFEDIHHFFERAQVKFETVYALGHLGRPSSVTHSCPHASAGVYRTAPRAR